MGALDDLLNSVEGFRFDAEVMAERASIAKRELASLRANREVVAKQERDRIRAKVESISPEVVAAFMGNPLDAARAMKSALLAVLE